MWQIARELGLILSAGKSAGLDLIPGFENTLSNHVGFMKTNSVQSHGTDIRIHLHLHLRHLAGAGIQSNLSVCFFNALKQ